MCSLRLIGFFSINSSFILLKVNKDILKEGSVYLSVSCTLLYIVGSLQSNFTASKRVMTTNKIQMASIILILIPVWSNNIYTLPPIIHAVAYISFSKIRGILLREMSR